MRQRRIKLNGALHDLRSVEIFPCSIMQLTSMWHSLNSWALTCCMMDQAVLQPKGPKTKTHYCQGGDFLIHRRKGKTLHPNEVLWYFNDTNPTWMTENGATKISYGYMLLFKVFFYSSVLHSHWLPVVKILHVWIPARCTEHSVLNKCGIIFRTHSQNCPISSTSQAKKNSSQSKEQTSTSK